MQTIQISSKTIIFAVVLILTLILLWIARDLLFSLFIAFILRSALKPLVIFLEKKGVPRIAATLTIYIPFIVGFIVLFGLVLPPIIFETANLMSNLPQILSTINPDLVTWVNADYLSQYLPNITNTLFSVVKDIFANIFFIVFTIFFGFYFLLEKHVPKRFFHHFLPEDKANKLALILKKAEKRMSDWFWGELTLMFIVGFMTFIGLAVLRIKYAIPLAVLAGLLELVPNIGPVMAAVPAAIVGFAQAPILGAYTIVLSLLVQQSENNLIVPLVMKRAVGLNPIVILVVLVLGGKIAGVLGALLAIPFYLFVETVLRDILADAELRTFFRLWIK